MNALTEFKTKTYLCIKKYCGCKFFFSPDEIFNRKRFCKTHEKQGAKENYKYPALQLTISGLNKTLTGQRVVLRIDHGGRKNLFYVAPHVPGRKKRIQIQK